MPIITIHTEQRKIYADDGANLLDVLRANEIYVNNACGGKGVCGKCKVRLVGGAISSPSESELRLIPEAELAEGVRMACLLTVEGDMTLELMQREGKHDVLTSGYVPEFDYHVEVSKKLIAIHKPTMEDQTPFEEQIRAQLDNAPVELSALFGQRLKPGAYTAVLRGGRVIALEAGDTRDSLYGVAIDIGTTTVVCELVDMRSGEALSAASQINAQKAYGLDVLTRITYEIEQPETGVRDLQKAIVDSINDMVEEACRKVGVKPAQVYEIAVGANCTMMHMLLGVDATPIGKAPFAPVFTGARELEAASIGLVAAPGARLYCLPSVSSYIGADIVAGAYVCDLKHRERNVMFIDIGTNGEIVLASKGRLMSCSCAAGPALEGMNISCGMRASEGAIEDVLIGREGIDLKVIGDTDPVGICGSGILAAVKELLRSGIVRKTGAFVKAGKFPEGDYRSPYIEVDENGKRSLILTGAPNSLRITMGDVRQVQLAKGAILSGFMALLDQAGITMDDLDQVLIAGQFGAHLPSESITGTGILPFDVEGRIDYVGNTSKTGAYMALMSSDVKRELEALAQEMEYLELGATPDYERRLTDCLIFPSEKDFKQRN